MSAKPENKGQLCDSINRFLRSTFNDPTVEIQEIGSSIMRIRVGQDSGMPVYYRVHVIKEI